jgi:hypothetical protein
VVTKFTIPYLFNIICILFLADHTFWLDFFNFRINVENSIAFFALNWVSSRDLCVVLKSFKFYLENICIDLLSEMSCRSFALNLFLSFWLHSESVNLIVVFFTWEI